MTRLQRNPSTFRLLRNPVTGRLHRAVSGGTEVGCSYCSGETPAQIKVSFSGLSVCSDCMPNTSPSGSVRYEWIFDPNSVDFIAGQNPADRCHWQIFDMSQPIIKQKNYRWYPDCRYHPDNNEWDYSYFLDVTRGVDDTVRVIFYVPGEYGDEGRLFDTGWVSTESPETYCIKLTNAPNIYGSGTCGRWSNWAYGGTVTVVEL